MKRKKRCRVVEVYVFVCFLMISSAITSHTQTLGDVNNDGTVNIVDALAVAQYSVQMNPSPFYTQAADVDASGSITIVDALLVAQYYVGIINQFPGAQTNPPTPVPTQVVTTTTTTTTTSTGGSGGGEVTKSGSTWNATVNGSSVYTGNKMFDAVNACINGLGSGTVNIRSSGDSGPGTGDIYAIKPSNNITLDFHGNTVNCNGDEYIVCVQADNKSNIAVRNLVVTGNPRYGIWFRTCSGIDIHSITMNLSGGLGIRVDDSKGGWSRDLSADNINITGAGNHAFETYGVDGIEIGTVNATDVAYCGVLLNNSRNATVGTVNGIRCCPGGGYAAFRCANSNGPNIRVNRVYARGCGRGFFSVSGSTDCTIDSVDIADCTDIGIWIQDSTNTHVNGGTVSNNANGCWAITGDSSGSSVNVSCN
ncbi:MAG: dockerin type I repeat-containing protein [Spirochaetales bacterium]|nr:dockerin type I repeat-containing protein [Spirochaetales bacterium]